MKNAEIEKFRGELLSNLEIEGLCEKNGQREENDIEDLEKFKKDYEIPALILDKPIPKESREIGINTTPTVEKNTILSNLFGETSSLIDKEIDPSSELNEYGKSSSTENKPNATQDEKSDFKTFEVPDSAIYDPPVEDDFSPRILDVPDNSVTDAQKK
ncbi:uncharacterized protein [Lepeophtheirus salmonis]|uniref:uncharacterized protein n=1 Tax=Lepeophtheirus salmonis TaxID=72036 RepID=UPI003AF372C4